MNINYTTLSKKDFETEDDYILRIGGYKVSGIIKAYWDELAEIFNENLGYDYGESYWRKRFHHLQLKEMEFENEIEEGEYLNAEEDFTNELCGKSVKDKPFDIPIEKAIVKLRDQRLSLNRTIRSEARKESLLDIVKEKLGPYESEPLKMTRRADANTNKAVYALIGDVHYGISFNNSIGVYNPQVCKQRLMDYCSEIIEIGKQNKANTCYVSLLGDMISGIAHQTIRIENKENVVEQIIGVSEIIASVLHNISLYFDYVYVNSVNGNHSRIIMNPDDSLNSERLDSLILYICKARLSNNTNVLFVDNEIDPSIGSFVIFDKTYISVHGDFDKNIKDSKFRIETLYGEHIDYFINGHMHVAEMKQEDCMYIQNGSVCGSGDEYTVRKRLFGPPTQTCLVCSEKGVDSIHVIKL